MSQFKKYLGIVTEGKDHVYNEESESIEKNVSGIKKLIPSQMEKFKSNFSKDERIEDTDEVYQLLNTIKIHLESRSKKDKETEMVEELLNHKDFIKMKNKSQMLITIVQSIREELDRLM
jgi:hypothetical protein